MKYPYLPLQFQASYFWWLNVKNIVRYMKMLISILPIIIIIC